MNFTLIATAAVYDMLFCFAIVWKIDDSGYERCALLFEGCNHEVFNANRKSFRAGNERAASTRCATRRDSVNDLQIERILGILCSNVETRTTDSRMP